ncbi:MAG TPA: HAD-IA family hydrolase [Bryobacteraceae bacterium]|nr:HAD-IA family hydrolase [Bryobacteraceae bacterium]
MSRPVLVFDMDGVLVDVSESYRATIVETVRHFTGHEIPRELIQQYKDTGGWNNDWALSQRIILDTAQTDVPYEEVIQVFQSYFFGPDNKGLVMREKWLPADGLLERLRHTYHLTIFTGRLRGEAAFTLNRFVPDLQWARVVGDDDVTRSKPDPDGLLQIAAENPGAALTYLGDTVDDARSARAAGVRFIGVAHPRHPHLPDLLRREGAAAVIEDINEIEGVL